MKRIRCWLVGHDPDPGSLLFQGTAVTICRRCDSVTPRRATGWGKAGRRSRPRLPRAIEIGIVVLIVAILLRMALDMKDCQSRGGTSVRGVFWLVCVPSSGAPHE
jgi:hypothetical protein